MPRPSRLLADVRPLRQSPAYRRMWAGSLVSSIGSMMTTFALSLQVYRLTHSAFAVGAIGLTSMIPILSVSLFGGSLADGADRRKVVLVTSSSLAAVSALLAVQASAGLRQVWLLYVLAAVAGHPLGHRQPRPAHLHTPAAARPAAARRAGPQPAHASRPRWSPGPPWPA